MDPAILTSIATATVSVLSPYLKKAAEKASEKAGEFVASHAWKKAKQVYDKLREAISPGGQADNALQNLIRSPENDQCQAQMTEVLIAMLDENTSLANTLATLLKEAAVAGADAEFHTNIQGEVQKLVQIGVVHGDVNL